MSLHRPARCETSTGRRRRRSRGSREARPAADSTPIDRPAEAARRAVTALISDLFGDGGRRRRPPIDGRARSECVRS
ncbi:hypothetical protein EVAR_90235_1 [Eumeta japonica]|uniref:Uncharacterized protein n=1 Tax=Eumeta variegata TaxID=151549 RepID=A0A4C1YSH3_EUMVA|nr:hypothetical protein EVAR_90235_1 [Eumeta japonica]